jgi:hypothetical protein
MNRTRLAAGVAIPVLLAVVLAVLLLQGHRPAGEAAPAQTVAPTTTAPPPITTQPEPPKATGENWLAIMRDILTYRHYLYENPQPNLLDQIYDRRCPCYAQERRALADLERRGWRYNDKGVTVLKTTLRGRGVGNSSIVALESIIQTAQQVLVDRNGKILQRKSASGSTKMTYELIRGKDDRWRVSFVVVGWMGG